MISSTLSKCDHDLKVRSQISCIREECNNMDMETWHVPRYFSLCIVNIVR